MGAPKQKWTAEEEAALKAGIAKYGVGKWSTILKDPEFSAALHMRSNVDLKDKWRNMQALASGLGSRQRSRPAVNNNQATPVFSDNSRALSTVVTGDVEVCDATPLAVISETVAICGSKRLISRLDDHILEAVTNLKEPRGSSGRSIAMYIEEHYLPPPNFKRLLAANLKLLTDIGKLIKVKHQYRIAPASDSLDVKKGIFPLLLEGKKDFPREETNTTNVLTSSTKYPQKAERKGNSITSLLLIGEDAGDKIARRNGQNVLTRADIDAELRKMMSMTPEEAAAAAEQAVKEAEAAIAEAEEATREAEDAEREAEEARAFAEASRKALKGGRIRYRGNLRNLLPDNLMSFETSLASGHHYYGGF